MIKTKDKQILLEYEGPYHFIKDEYSMTGEYADAFTNLNRQEHPVCEETVQFLLGNLESVLTPSHVQQSSLFKSYNSALVGTMQADDIARRLLQAPMRTRDLFKRYYYLPRRGYTVISVPYFLWDPIVTFQKQVPYLKHLLRGIHF